jgi:hypothetical protein
MPNYWKLSDRKTVFCDVDETLVLWKDDPTDLQNSVIQVANGNLVVKFHRRHIALVKQFFVIGWNVIIWSQGGSDHAEHVVKACGLQDHVHAILPKPDVVLDDKGIGDQGIRRSFKVDDL